MSPSPRQQAASRSSSSLLFLWCLGMQGFPIRFPSFPSAGGEIQSLHILRKHSTTKPHSVPSLCGLDRGSTTDSQSSLPGYHLIAQDVFGLSTSASAFQIDKMTAVPRPALVSLDVLGGDRPVSSCLQVMFKTV